jgi:hypothetical protein
MANLGFIPTKTTVEVREPDGDSGTIPGAVRSSAGVMTAAHVAMLEEVYQWHLAEKAGAGAALSVPQAAPDLSQYVTRHEVQQVLARLPVAPQPSPQGVIDVTPRVRALETALESMRSIKPAAAPNDLATRLALVEARQAELENSLVEVATVAGEVEETLRGLYALVSVEEDDDKQLLEAG